MSTIAPIAQANQTTPIQAKETTLKDRFGSGRYFALQCEVFKDAQRLFNIPEAKAETIAKAVSTSLGSIMANSQVSFKGLDKLTKDGKLSSLSEIAKVKGLPLTNEVSMMRALAYCNNARANHVTGVFALDDTMADWVKGL